ncbi:MAG: hypothetical protein Q7O66_07625, partial [Dehalococcoidia bacterium]|nr:hypothetical protein [Dehalococcoidia bacterium]
MRYLTLPLVALFLILAIYSSSGSSVAETPPPTTVPQAIGPDIPAPLKPQVSRSVKNDVSPPLLSIKPVVPGAGDDAGTGAASREVPLGRIPRGINPATTDLTADPVVQSSPGLLSMPATIQNFEGVNNINAVYPPDTNGDVGPNHYVQWVNLSLQIWDKNGTSLYGPVQGNTLWSGFGGPCQSFNHGDPVVLYDHLADRWFISQFAVPGGATGYYQCIAVSQTGDPTGSWYRYAFL